MASPAKHVNVRDPSGLRRFEDASAKEMTALVDQAVERIADSLGPNPTAKEIEAAVNREAAQLTTASKALLVEKLTETYRRSSIRAEQLLRAGGMRVTGSLGPRGITPELRDRIELHALVNAESLSADLKARATRSLLTSVDKGEGMRPARKRLMEETGIDKVSAERIARTEIMNAYRDVNDEQFKRYGVQEEEWLAALDDRTCDECAGLHGKRFPVGQRPHVHGGTDINCRCIMLPVIPEVGQAERS
jgi:SPP1 gp7 family putative phage head morphogenesis protein